jgi:hypothetical protein
MRKRNGPGKTGEVWNTERRKIVKTKCLPMSVMKKCENEMAWGNLGRAKKTRVANLS